MLAFTALVAILWILPKGEAGFLWLLMILPAAVFLFLVFQAGDPRRRIGATRAMGLKLAAPLAALWFGGGFLLPDTSNSALAMLLTLLHLVWPLVMIIGLAVRLTMRKMLPRAARKDSIAAHRQQEVEYELRLQREMNSQSEPTADGRITGFEPADLADVSLPDHPHRYGTPGAGLSGSGFGATEVALGQLGELNLARSLEKTDLLARFATFWSVHMPDETVGASQKLQGDIDAVVVTGRSIYLIDVKNYTQGDVTWILEGGSLRMIDGPTGGYVGGPRSMSRNMELAVRRVTTKFQDLGITRTVVGRVVMMPTERGTGSIDADVRWPGDIPAITLDHLLSELQQEPGFTEAKKDSEHIVRVFRWLVKDETGSAPRLGEAWKQAPGVQKARAPRPLAGPASPSRQHAAGGKGHPPAMAASTAAPSTAPGPATPQANQQSTPARTCEECGAEFGPEWTFCWECGRA